MAWLGAVGSALGSAGSAIGGAASSAGSAIGSAAGSMASGLGQGVTQMAGGIGQMGSGAAQGLRGMFSGGGGGAPAMGSSYPAGAGQGALSSYGAGAPSVGVGQGSPLGGSVSQMTQGPVAQQAGGGFQVAEPAGAWEQIYQGMMKSQQGMNKMQNSMGGSGGPSPYSRPMLTPQAPMPARGMPQQMAPNQGLSGLSRLANSYRG